MEYTIQQTVERFNNCSADQNYRIRRSRETATKLYNALQTYAKPLCTILATIDPSFNIVCNYTLEELCENKNGEREVAVRAIKEAVSYVNKTLDMYEDAL